MDTSAESWWATVFLPRLGPSMAMGFLSASRFAGKIEAERGKVRMFNFAEGVSGSSPDTVWSEPFYVSFNPDPSAAVEGYASMAAASAGARIRHSPVFGWGSWSNYHDSINEKTVLENANHFVGVVPSAKNRAVIEVDHGWEERISTHRPETCWTARREFSADLPAMIGRVHDAMLKNGLWVVPFAVNEGSRHLDAHKEYLVRDETGRPMRVGGKGKGYCVDPTHPDGERWLRELFSRLMRLGIDYFKMDYLRVLLAPEPSDPKDSLDVKRVYWNGATRVEAYRHGLGIIRDTVGEAVYLLACGAPSLPSAGLIDGFRVGQDIAIAWNDGRTGIRDCARNIACNYFWHKRLWRNDPDYLVLPRENNLRRFWATAVALSGGSVIVSADLSTLDSSQEHDLNAVMPPWGESAAPMEWGEDDFPAKWCLPVTAHGESYYLVGFLNGDESPRLFHMDARDLDWPEPPGHFIAWNFWGMEMMGESSGPFSITVPGRDVGLFCVRSLRSHPMLAGTSLHYTMGAVELDKVEWSSVDLSLTCDLSECAPRKGFLYFHVPDSYLLRSKSSGRKTTQGGVLTVPVGEGRSTSIRLEFRKAGEGGR